MAQLKDDLRARDATIQAQKADIERLEDCVSQERIVSGVWKEKSDESRELLRALTKTVKQNKTSLLLAVANIEDGSKSRKASRVRTGRAGKR
jgi:thioredoxin-like negative regulator of GroEL